MFFCPADSHRANSTFGSFLLPAARQRTYGRSGNRVNNPPTFPPVCYAAWKLGRRMLHGFTQAMHQSLPMTLAVRAPSVNGLH
jgi:hypothetical protein